MTFWSSIQRSLLQYCRLNWRLFLGLASVVSTAVFFYRRLGSYGFQNEAQFHRNQLEEKTSLERSQVLNSFQSLTGRGFEDSREILNSNSWSLTASLNSITPLAQLGYHLQDFSNPSESTRSPMFSFTSRNTPKRELQDFHRKFEDEWGIEQCPAFFDGTFEEAVSACRTSSKLLFVYIHSEYHIDTPAFCRATFCTEGMRQLCGEEENNIMVWMSSVFCQEGYRVNQMMSVTTYPFCAVYCPSTQSLIDRVEGTITVEDLTARLLQLIERNNVQLVARRAEAREREANRRIVDEQNEEYQRTLAADREKRRAAEQARREEQERIRREEELEKQRKERLRRKADRLQPEPSEQEENICHIMFRLPSGSRLSRRFALNTPISSFHDYIDTQETGEVEESAYDLVCSYPKKVLADQSKSILDYGLVNGSGGRVLLNVQPHAPSPTSSSAAQSSSSLA